MLRLSPYLGIILAILISILFFSFPNRLTVPPSTPPPASSTDFLLPPASATTTAEQKPAVPAEKTKSPNKAAKTLLPKTVETAAATVPVSAHALAATPPVDELLDNAAAALRSALVNIICYAPAGGGIHSISGSGIFIESKGIILTNAHIAQYFLFADRSVSCTIRTGGPATDSYKAALIYLSPKWVHANADILTKTLPTGTGEYDFALLAVTKSASSQYLPSSFPSVPLAEVPPVAGAPVVIASYGAQFLETSQVQSSLFPTVVFGSVKDIFTFSGTTVDVIALGGSAAAQEGSSGGGIADASGALVGVITTSTITGATNTRSLEAITASYVRAEYAGEMGTPLNFMLDEPVSVAISDFASRIPVLEAILTANLP